PAGRRVGRGRRAALAVDRSHAVRGDVGGVGVGALDLVELRDLLVGGHHRQEVARLGDARLRREGADTAGACAERAGDAAGARRAAAPAHARSRRRSPAPGPRLPPPPPAPAWALPPPPVPAVALPPPPVPAVALPPPPVPAVAL